MHWWNQLKASNNKTVKNALIPTAVFLVLIGVVIYTDLQLNKQSRKVQIIPVFSLQSDDESTENQQQIELLVDEMITKAVNQAKSIVHLKDFEISTLKSFLNKEKLTPQQQTFTLAQLSKVLYAEKEYLKVEQVLQLLKLKDRIKFQVQFLLAQSQTRQDKYQLAMDSYQRLLTHQVNNQAALLNYSILLSKTNQTKKAETSFQKLIKISNGRIKAKAYSGLAAIQVKLKQYSTALSLLKKSIEYRPQHAITWKKFAQVLNLTDAAPEVIYSGYQKALSLANLDFRFQNDIGLFLLSRLEFIKATSHLLKAKKLAKSSSEIRLNLAMSYLERNKNKNARKHLKWILKRKKKTANYEIATALLSYSQKNYSKAMALLSSTEFTDKYKTIAKYYFARAANANNQQAISEKAFKHLLTDPKWQYLSQLRISRIELAQKRYQPSLVIINRLLQTTLNRESLLYQKSQLLSLIGDNANALVAIQKAFEISPRSQRVIIRLAEVLHRNNNDQAAIEQLKSFLTNKRRNIRAREALANIYLDQGNAIAAIEEYQLAINSAPENVRIKFKLSQILISVNDFPPAIILLNEILLQKSNHIEARMLLAQAYYSNAQYTQGFKEANFILKLDPENTEAIKLKNILMEKL